MKIVKTAWDAIWKVINYQRGIRRGKELERERMISVLTNLHARKEIRTIEQAIKILKSLP